MLYSTLYDEKSSLDLEISKDYDKFSIRDLELGSSFYSASDGSEEKKSFKVLLNEDLNIYVGLIQSLYHSFKQNHYSKYSFKGVSNKTEVYQTNKSIVKSIEQFYFVDEDKFKIKSEILEQKQEDIGDSCRTLIEKCGGIEMELQKILEHSIKMQRYLGDNLQPIKENVVTMSEKITKMKGIKEEIKKKYIMSSSQLMIKETKRKNVKKLHCFLSAFKKLKDIFDLLKILITNPKKYKTTFDLMAKAKDTLEMCRQVKGSYTLYNEFANSYKSYLEKVFNQMNSEFSDTILSCFSNFINFSQLKVTNTNETFSITKFVYDKLSSSSDKAKEILMNISFANSVSLDKVREITQCYIKSDIINSLYLKMRGILTGLSKDIMITVLESLRKEFKETNNTNGDINNFLDNIGSQVTVIADVEKNEQCILLCLIQGRKQLLSNIQSITNEICNLISNTGTNANKKYEVIKRNFNEEFKEIIKLIEISTNDIVRNQVEKCLKESLSHSNLDTFIENFYIIKDIVGTNHSFDSQYVKYQNEYINNWYQDKNKRFNSPIYQNWEEIKEIPSNFQNLIDIFCTYEINTNYIADDTVNPFDVINTLNNIEAQYQISNSVGYVTIGNCKLKCNQCSLDIIKTSHEVIKLFSLFSVQTWGTILTSYRKLQQSFGNYQNEQILNGLNKVVSQTEISMTYSIVELIRQIRIRFTKNNSFTLLQKHIDKKIIDEFFDLNNLFDNMSHSSKVKIINLIDIHCVESSLKELEKISLPNYSIAEGDVPVNSYALIIVKLLKSIYESMLNAYEETFIVSTIRSSFEKFLTRLENFIFKGQKIEDEQCLTQFRKDMIFMKKNISSLTLIDSSEFKSRIENMMKKVLPERMMKPKK